MGSKLLVNALTIVGGEELPRVPERDLTLGAGAGSAARRRPPRQLARRDLGDARGGGHRRWTRDAGGGRAATGYRFGVYLRAAVGDGRGHRRRSTISSPGQYGSMCGGQFMPMRRSRILPLRRSVDEMVAALDSHGEPPTRSKTSIGA